MWLRTCEILWEFGIVLKYKCTYTGIFVDIKTHDSESRGQEEAGRTR